MKDYVLAITKRDGKIIRKRVFRDVNILRRYYAVLFDLGHETEDGYPSRANSNTFLEWERVVLIEAKDC